MYDDALIVLNRDKKLKSIISSVGEFNLKTISNPVLDHHKNNTN